MRRVLQIAAVATLVAESAWAQTAVDKIGELRLSLVGLTASVEPAAPVVPKNIASAVRIVVRAGGNELSLLEVARFVGNGYEVQAELSGPGLRDTLLLHSLQLDGEPAGDPLLLPFPPLAVAGDYVLSNVRLVVAAKPALDVAARIPLKVIDQILVTSVKTRPLTLDEIKQKGIVLDKDDYLAFEFTLGVTLNSKPVNFSFPVVFDRDGVEVPQPPTTDVDGVGRQVQRPEVEGGGTLIQPIMMALEEEGPGGKKIGITMPDGRPIRIPSVLVIPGNVGYLKQFFSAQLFVANGAPVGSGLVVKDVTGKATLPPGADGDFTKMSDNPLAFPEIERNGQTITQPATMAVRGVGVDGVPGTDDDVDAFDPGEQGQAEFLIRGELEGFHKLDFDIKATLEGLPVGPVKVTGKASGAVLVRNPYFDMTFTVPSVVRAQETFKLFVTLSNVGKGAANDVTVVLDNGAISGAHLACAPDSTEPWCRVNAAGLSEQEIPTIAPGDSKTLEYRFVAEKTGKVSAAYLRFETEGGTNNVTGRVAFKLGVGDSGIPLSPDTLVLPASVDALPTDVVAAAMRVLGQAWSLANAPSGSLPAGHARTTQAVVTQKAIALAEAGLRIRLRDNAAAAVSDSVRDLIFDFFGGSPVDPGFDQVLRKTEAGRAFVRALGGALAATATSAGPLPYENAVAQLAASGPDFLSFSATALPAAELSLLDALGRRSSAGPLWETGVPGLALVPFDPSGGSLLGVLTEPAASPYTLALGPQTAFAVTIPAGDGSFRRVTGVTSFRARIVLDLSRPTSFRLEEDAENDGTFELSSDLVPETILPQGPQLLTASVIGPETLPSAGSFGFEVALLFDRIVDAASAANTANYSIPDNAVRSARRQLTGRLVFGVLALPEGPHVPTTVGVSGVLDPRGAVGPAATVSLKSRLEDPGAVVSGRIVSAEGAPVPGAMTFYANTSDFACPFGPASVSPIAVLPLDGTGRYELRYVRRNSCGLPFTISTVDPVSGNRREVSGVVRNDGERIVLDIALIGRGAVAGTVRTLAGVPVVGAKLLVRSVTDPNQPQNGETDGDGRYRVDNLTVGQVVVEAAKGIGLGRSSGRIFAAGTTATVDVTLDSGAVRVSGRFRKVQDGVFSPVARALLSYNIVASQGGGPAGYTFTDDDGKYVFEGMPVGAFRIVGSGSGASASVAGVGLLGDDQQNVDLVYEVPTPSNVNFGTVKGFVRLPDGTAPTGAIVAEDVSGTVIFDGSRTGLNGAFRVDGVRVGVAKTLGAVTLDGKRRGYTTFTIDPVTRLVEDVIITLSGLGTAQFTVKGAQGQLLANQEVRLLGFGLTVGGCHDPCGCLSATTDALGIARFQGLPLGNVQVQALRAGPGYMDVARGSASVIADGQTGFGTLQFRGVGTVSGELKGTDGVVLQGGSVTMWSSVFVNDGAFTCGLVAKESHAGPIDPSTSKFSFKNVLVGPVSVTATNDFAPTPVGASGTLTTAGDQLFFSLKFVDTTAGELSGKVFYPDGVTPVGAGVEVTTTGALPEVKVKTDASGAFHFAKIFPQGSYSMIARDPATGGVAREYVYLQAQQDLHHDLRLKGTGTVRVRVVDGADQPVLEAFVKLRESDFPNRAFEAPIGVANLGVATIEGVFEGGYSVEVSDPFGRGGRGSGTLPRPGDNVEVKVRLTSTGKVSGHVLMPDATESDLDNPRVPFAVVTLTAGGRRIGQATTPGSGEGCGDPPATCVGFFEFDYVPAGSVRVEVQDPLTLRSGFAVGSIDSEGQELTLDAKLQGLGSVTGLVTTRDAGGQPAGAGGAHVDIVSGTYMSCTFADGTGHYTVAGVPEGRVTVTAALSTGGSLGNFLAATASGTLSGEGGVLTLDVALRDSGQVTGQVLRPDGVTPGPISTVQVSVGGFGGATQSATTDEEGRFHFERVPSGAATLTVDVLGSIDKAKKSFDVPAGVIDVPVVLNGVGSLRGVAFDSSGTNPIAGDVTLTGSGAFPYTEYVRVGSTGQFVWPELLAGPVTLKLSVQSGGLTLYGSATGEVVPGQETTLDVKLQDTGTVIGVVKRSDGVTPAYGTNVTVQLVSSGATIPMQAQSDGSFMAKGVPLGAFTLRANDPQTGGVALVTGRSVVLNLETVDLETIVLDDSPVAVVSVDPPDGAQGVAVNRPIQIVFTDPLAFSFGVSVKNGSAGLGFIPSLSADKLTLTLNGSWPDARELTVEVGTGVTDIYGRHPAQAFTSRFRTVDLSPPQVTAVVPANLAIQVDPGAVVTLTFNEALSDSTNFGTLVTLSGGVAGSAVRTSPTSVVFTPASQLALNASYSVTVNGAVDLSGNQQTIAFSSSFKTLDTVPPSLVVTSPAPGGWVKAPRPSISVSLSDAVSGIDAPSGALVLDGVTVNPFRSTASMSFTPTADLTEGQHDVSGSVSDRAGNTNATSASFGVDTVPPTAAVVTGVSEGQVVQGTLALGGASSDATSGIAKIEILSENALIATANAPSFSVSYNTNALSEGPHTLTARAVDVAGNVGPQGAPVHAIVDNKTLTVTITSPSPNTRVRDNVLVKASVSEPVTYVEFRAGASSFFDSAPPYEAVLDLALLGEGTQPLEARATAADGDVALAGVNVFIDRTPPAAPDPARISAEESDPGFSSVAGLAAAVEGSATVEVKHVSTGVVATTMAAQDGSFALRIQAALNDELDVTAIDGVLNRSPSTRVTVARTVSPGGIPLVGLRLWAGADQGVTSDATTGAVSAVADQSGQDNHLIQSATGSRPVLVGAGFNGWPVLRFDGQNDFLQFTSGLGTIRTVFWVAGESALATSGYRSLLGHTSASDFAGGIGNPGTIWYSAITGLVKNGQTYLNGELVDGTATLRPRGTMAVISLATAGNTSADRFGTAPGGGFSPWFGDLAELLIYERALSSSERRAVEDYLLAKYRPITPTTATPIILPSGGAFSGSTTVTLRTTTPGAEIRYTLDGQEPTAASPLYVEPFVITETTTVKAKAIRGGAYLDSATATATLVKAEESPVLAASGLRLWLRADAGIATNGGEWVTDWIDQSGQGNHATQTNGLSVPRFVAAAVNGLPAVRFDGSNDFVQFTAGLGTIRTVFWVAGESALATSGYRSLLGHSSASDFAGGFGNPGAIWYSAITGLVRNGQTFLNGQPIDGTTTPRPRGTMAVISLVTTGNTSADRFGIAPGGGFGPWFGDLAELIVYDRDLPESERLLVENYLRVKYWHITAVPAASSVSLSWLPRPGSVRYDLERSTTSGSGFATIATGLLGTSYSDATVASGTTYYYRIVAVDGSGNRFPSREAVGSSVFVGTGSGLTGAYYNSVDLTGSPALVRVDPVVDFNFSTGAAAPGLNTDNFSVRWTGEIEAPVSGDFVFSTNSDDGVRLRIDGQLVIDDWTDHGDTQNSSQPVPLQAGQRYDVSLEYYDRSSSALIRLKWSYPGQALQTIPQAQLYP